MRMQSVSLIVLLLLSLFSCKPKQIKQPKCPLITPEIYERDKRQVADCIMRNIEYIRVNYGTDVIHNMDVPITISLLLECIIIIVKSFYKRLSL